MGEARARPAPPRSRSLAARGGLAVVLSVVANALVLQAALARSVAPGFRPLSLPSVAFLSAAGAAGAAVVYWLLRRSVDEPVRTFRRLAVAVLVVSFVPDVALLAFDPAATVAGVVVLVVMHVVVAGISVGLLTGWRGDARA